MGSKGYTCDKCKADLTAQEMTQPIVREPNDSDEYARPCLYASVPVLLPDGTATAFHVMLCLRCTIEIGNLVGYTGPSATPEAEAAE